MRPFRIEIPDSDIADLKARLAHTRWPNEPLGNEHWDWGTNLSYMRRLVAYWRDEYDWRAAEARLNRFPQFIAEIAGANGERHKIHFVHERGSGEGPLPLILTHGWPSTFREVLDVVERLAHPERFGGKAEDGFDVIVPSLLGYGFSSRPQLPVGPAVIAELWHALMHDVLGYSRFAAAGGDFGSTVARLLALRHPEQMIGIHLTDIGYFGDPAFTSDLGNLSQAEHGHLGATQGWFYQEGAYTMIQSTKPQTLAYGLTDSPVGMAAWMIEKFRSWSDCDGDVEKRFSKDELLTNVMIYWVTDTFNSSIRTYYENGHTQSQLQPGQHI